MNTQQSHASLVRSGWTVPVLLVLSLSMAALFSPVVGGDNETPGESRRPHSFASYSANLWEFGTKSLATWNKYVVQDQHYDVVGSFHDTVLDLDPGTAGIAGFTTFCTWGQADVMYLTAHGISEPFLVGTVIQQFPNTAAGMAARDATLAAWEEDYPNGEFGAMDFSDGYGIIATRNYYSMHFRAPQALAWWSTCYSFDIGGMIGPGKARDYLGYSGWISVDKSENDEDYVLRRMDGKEGQLIRPLKKAIEGVNAGSGSDGQLNRRGPGNTVLSPSVLLVSPPDGSIFCEDDVGFVQFDCTMDTSISPDIVVVASGYVALEDHQWLGDDRIIFWVNVIEPTGVATYDVIEFFAKSEANNARLDGNQDPAGKNAEGPNRDDYIWHTYCLGGPSPPVSPQQPTPPPWPHPAPGGGSTLTLPLVNNTDSTKTVEVRLLDDDGWLSSPDSVEVEVPAESIATVPFEFEIPPDVEPGDSDLFDLEVETDGDIFYGTGSIVVGDHVIAWFAEPLALGAGMSSHVDLFLQNRSGIEVNLTYLQLANTAGWTVTPETTDPLTLEPNETAERGFIIDVPGSEPPGTESEFTATATVADSIAFAGNLGTASVGLPVVVHWDEVVDLVPGNTDAVISLRIENKSTAPISPTYMATSAQGFAITVGAPGLLAPESVASGSLSVSVPPDGGLVGVNDVVTLRIEDGSGYATESSLVAELEPVLELTTEQALLHTGNPIDTIFQWPFSVRNRSDEAVNAFVFFDGGGLMVHPPDAQFYIAGEATQNWSFNVTVFADFPAETLPGMFFTSAMRWSTSEPFGDTQQAVDVRVQQPVTVDMLWKGRSGAPGDLIEVEAAIENITETLPFSGDASWSDTQGWIPDRSVMPWSLMPGGKDTLSVSLQLPSPAPADTDSVFVALTFNYATGTPAQTGGGIKILLVLDSTDVDDGLPAAPSDGLYGAFPNPIRSDTRVRFALSEAGPVSLTVHDVTGRKVRTLIEANLPAGIRDVRWEGQLRSGAQAPSGIYFLRLKTTKAVHTTRATVTR